MSSYMPSFVMIPYNGYKASDTRRSAKALQEEHKERSIIKEKADIVNCNACNKVITLRYDLIELEGSSMCSKCYDSWMDTY